MTFGGGPKSCIGYRFALLELKVILFTLVRGFEFGQTEQREEIVKKTA